MAPAQRGVLPLRHLQGAKRAGCSLTERAPALMRCVSRLCGRDLFGWGLGIEGAAAMGGVRMLQTRKQARKWRNTAGTDLLFTLSPVSVTRPLCVIKAETSGRYRASRLHEKR